MSTANNTLTLKEPELKEVDYFAGITGCKPATEIVAGTHLKIAIVGKPKVGKSWFAATAPGPVLVYDFDNRAESLAGKEGVMIKTLFDANQISPTAFKTIEADLSILKYRKGQGKPIPKTFVFDTITFFKNYIQNELFTQGLAHRSIKLSPTTSVRMSKNWDAVNGVHKALEYVITEFASLGNLIFVFHEMIEKDKIESKPDAPVYTDKITVDPQNLEYLLSSFNEVYRIEIDANQKYKVTCRPGHNFNASTTLKIDKEEEPNIQNMLKKHQQRLTESEKK